VLLCKTTTNRYPARFGFDRRDELIRRWEADPTVKCRINRRDRQHARPDFVDRGDMGVWWECIPGYLAFEQECSANCQTSCVPFSGPWKSCNSLVPRPADGARVGCGRVGLAAPSLGKLVLGSAGPLG
jgi:hypothetical protein